MNAQDILRELETIARRPAATIESWRAAHPGAKVAGCVHCLPPFVPEELLDAAGVLSVGIWGSERPIARAEALMQPFACSMARTALELGMEGLLSGLDGVIFSTPCDTIRNLAEIWKYQFPATFVRSVVFPVHTDQATALPFLAGELARFREALGAWTGKPVTDAAIAASLAKFEATRRALDAVAAFRMEHPERLRAREMALPVQAASVMDRGEFAAKARALVAALPAREPVLTGRRRVLLSGTLPLPLAVVDTIEACGGLIVADDVGLGAKYFERTLDGGADPMERLARSQFTHTPVCTIFHGTTTRAAHLLARARASGAQAVVINGTKFCEPEFFDYPDLKKDLDAAGMPSLLVETELSTGGAGALATRIGAFLESLE